MKPLSAFVLTFGGLTLLLVLAEPSLRVYDAFQKPLTVACAWDRPEYWNNPGEITHTDWFSVRVSYFINHLGLRGPETTLDKPKGTKRLLLLGGSAVFGATVKDDETLTAYLQPKMPAKWEVLNGGVIGYRIEDEIGWFKYRGRFFAPDVVVLALVDMDAQTPDRYAQTHPVAMDLNSRVNRVQLPRLFPRTFRHLSIWMDMKPVADRVVACDTTLMARYPPQWAKIAAPLKELAQECRKAHCQLILAYLPNKLDLVLSPVPPEPRRTLARIADQLDLPFIDFLVCLPRWPEVFYPFTDDYAHQSAGAYKREASYLADALGKGPKT